MKRRAFLAFAAGVGSALSPLAAAAKPKPPPKPKPVGVYSNIYSNTY